MVAHQMTNQPTGKERPRAWRPMRSAPRKTVLNMTIGQPILVAVRGLRAPIVMWWCERAYLPEPGWESVADGPIIPDSDELLGWQPIDPLPKRRVP